MSAFVLRCLVKRLSEKETMTHSGSSNSSEHMELGSSPPQAHKGKPRGRPPQNYIWLDGEHGYVHVETGTPFDRDVQKVVLRSRKTASERRRYWDPTKDVRARRLLRCQSAKTKAIRGVRTLDKWVSSSQTGCVQTTKQ